MQSGILGTNIKPTWEVKSKIALTRSALEISNEIKMEAKRCTIRGTKRIMPLL